MNASDFSKRDYYRRLGIPRSATLAEIKEAYREIARVFHPDSNHYGEIVEYELDEEDKKVFQLVTAAYDTLIKDDKRVAYDKTLAPELHDFINGEQEITVKNSKKWEGSAEDEFQKKQEEKLKARGQVFNNQVQTSTRIVKPGQKLQTFEHVSKPSPKPAPPKDPRQERIELLKRHLNKFAVVCGGAVFGALLYFYL